MTNEVLKRTAEQFKKNIETVLDLCESEIEKIFISKIIEYVVNRPMDFAIGFIIDYPDTDEIDGKLYYKEEINYYSKGSGVCPARLYGIKIFDFILNNYIDIFPQRIRESCAFSGELGSKQYRLDFGIYKYKFSEPNIIVKKFCVECDGFEFHNSKEAIKNDNTRMKSLLLLDGYITIRYLGTEIYHMNDGDIGYLLMGILKN